MQQVFEPQPPRPSIWWGASAALFALIVIGIDYGFWTFFFETRHDLDGVVPAGSDLYSEIGEAGNRVQATAATVARVAAVGSIVVPAVLYLLRVRRYAWTALAIAFLMHPTIFLLTRPEFALIDRWT
ncbi:hypothetical protein [Occultella kanbiaonis]|uniref:hypothetical protein n=1 Tax=Occultella kanbiaonis TaxID=2675754 RepID=UPI0012B8E05E|nr:hypothetical protein [Occultella kanbiaonis]